MLRQILLKKREIKKNSTVGRTWMKCLSALRGKVERIKIAVSGVHVPPSVIVLPRYSIINNSILYAITIDLNRQTFKYWIQFEELGTFIALILFS